MNRWLAAANSEGGTHSLTHSLTRRCSSYFLVLSCERKPNKQQTQSSPHTAGLLGNASQLPTVTFRAQPEGVTAGPDTSVRYGPAHTRTVQPPLTLTFTFLNLFLFIFPSILHTLHSSLCTHAHTLFTKPCFPKLRGWEDPVFL